VKLVRDQIPSIIKSQNKTLDYYVASNDEHKRRLFEKMIEELNEFRDEPNVEELADMYEVLLAMCEAWNISLGHVKDIANLKRINHGSFDGRVVLVAVDGETISPEIVRVKKNVEEVLYTNEVEEHVEKLLHQYSMSPTFFISTKNELMLMAQGEDAGGIRDEYYEGKDDKYFQDVLDLFDKKIKK